MDQEHERLRQTYRICRLGFAILAFALILASLTSLVFFLRFIDFDTFAWITQSAWFYWLDVPIVWGCLIGTYLLWGRWPDSGWQRRAGFLVLMCAIDLVLWFLNHSDDLGLRLGEVGHHWLRLSLGEALGWAEFALVAGLSCDLMAHFGVEQAPEAGKATRSLAATGASVWTLYFIQQTAWNRGWPLQAKGFLNPESKLLYVAFQMVWAITLIQVTALTIATTRQATRVLAEMDAEERDDDLLFASTDYNFTPHDAPDDSWHAKDDGANRSNSPW
ncbi:hypothetical protein ACYOEI_15675 [Singulisphaera rosea]